MSKDSSFSRKDLSATMWAINGAVCGLLPAIALSAPLSTVILSSLLGTILGQIFARWLFKRDPSILKEQGPTKPYAALKYSAGIALCAALVLFLLYILDPLPLFLMAGAGAMLATIIAFGFLSSIVARYLERSDRD